jgi:hypothetical protein
MTAVILATLIVAVLAVVVYVGRERLGAQGLGMAALRTIALGALFVALFNPGRLRRVAGGSPTVLLDASLSMDAAGGAWEAALDSARALAQSGLGHGTLFRFGSRLAPFDTLPPVDGASRVRAALEASAGRLGPVFVVSDGELQDGSVLPPTLTHGMTVTTLPRDTIANAALLDVTVNRRVQRSDSVRVDLTIGTWGGLDTTAATVELQAGDRPVLRRRVTLPPSPGTAQRTLFIPAGALTDGVHVLRIRIAVAGDGESRDDTRRRVVTVSSQPTMIVLVDPADVEGRFLARELSDVAGTPVRGFARVQDDVWLDMNTLSRTDAASVQRLARGTRLVVIRGADRFDLMRTSAAVWHWPAASDTASEFFAGDWYVTPGVQPSPLAGRLAAATWDSVPPLTGIVPFIAGAGEWVALSGRLARRGADRPLLIGRDSSGVRRLTTAGLGWWRWVLRGGASREAYRTLIASGADWLLRTGAVQRRAPLTAAEVTQRGRPVIFRWQGDDPPDSSVVRLTGGDSTVAVTLRFDAQATAPVLLEPGVYRWSASNPPDASGIAVVEEYSDEYHLQPVTLGAGAGESGSQLIMQRARRAWWLFLVAMAALLGEWGWRQRRGLP